MGNLSREVLVPWLLHHVCVCVCVCGGGVNRELLMRVVVKYAILCKNTLIGYTGKCRGGVRISLQPCESKEKRNQLYRFLCVTSSYN